jgi:hypothetical protein
MSSSGEKALNIIGWILQVIIWGLLALSIIIKKPLPIIALIIVYLLYILIEFCGPTSCSLCHKKNVEGMKEKMGKLFRTPPVIEWEYKCFHYSYTTDKKKVTKKGTEKMRYYSSRDISGPFNLNCDANSISKKYYIKLELSEDISFADDLTEYDYKKQLKNLETDIHISYEERKYIPGMEEYYLVKIGKEEPPCVNCGLFFLFTVLTLVEFYQLYVNQFNVYQDFCIKKVISTRYNLNSGKYNEIYKDSNPFINLIKIQYKFQPSDYNYLNRDYTLPQQEEAENPNHYNQNDAQINVNNKNEPKYEMPQAPTSETLNQPTEQMFNVGNPSLFGNKTINNQ